MLERLLPELSLPGNEQLCARLEGMIDARRLPHALIVEGEDGQLCGKLARLCAHAFLCNCDSPLAGDCRACRLIAAYGSHADIIEVEGTGKTGAISVDAVRALQEQVRLIPADGSGQVYLLEGCDSMLPAAQNAFLKLFEEPPAGVMLIMTCRSASALLETIRSRGCILRIAGEQDNSADEAREEARAAADAFAAALVSDKDADSLLLTGRYSKPSAKNPAVRKELALLLEGLRGVFRDALVIGAGSGTLVKDAGAGAQLLARSLPPERVAALLDELPEFERALKANAPIPLLTTAMCVRLRRAAGK